LVQELSLVIFVKLPTDSKS